MGQFKVFQVDSSGSLQMLGEDSIEHTPRNETLKLTVGRAFDIVAERKRTHFQWVLTNNHRTGCKETFQIEIRNRKKTAEKVYVIERSWGEFKVFDNNMAMNKLDSNTFQFPVELKANEVKKVLYSIESKF